MKEFRLWLCPLYVFSLLSVAGDHVAISLGKIVLNNLFAPSKLAKVATCFCRFEGSVPFQPTGFPGSGGKFSARVGELPALLNCCEPSFVLVLLFLDILKGKIILSYLENILQNYMRCSEPHLSNNVLWMIVRMDSSLRVQIGLFWPAMSVEACLCPRSCAPSIQGHKVQNRPNHPSVFSYRPLQ